jgi:isopropylmalate/homocitrate/citramalate synthase/DNA-binding Lrp family transcriptional regulator
LDDYVIPLKTEPLIDDSTLRDGVQMPGIAVSPEDTAQIALLLESVGVERIELHMFQPHDRKAIRLIQDRGIKARIAGWCRAVKEDVDNALALDLSEIGISHPVSPIHLEAKWPNRNHEELIRRVAEVIEYAAKDHGLVTFFHGEDSTRAPWNLEKEFIDAAVDAGADVYRICDTVGVGLSLPDAPLPRGIPLKIKRIREETKVPAVEIHAHDDLGNAVENTLAAIRAASGLYDKIYASTTFLGIGERAGNAETEKTIMNLYVHHGVRKYESGLSKLKEVADFISHATGVTIPPNKAIVGEYAFAHESGIHAHGALRDPSTYEPYPPELVGNRRIFTIGKQSGKAIIKEKMEELLGTRVDDDSPILAGVVEAVKRVFEKGRRGSLKESEFREIVNQVSKAQRVAGLVQEITLDEDDLRLLRSLQSSIPVDLKGLARQLGLSRGDLEGHLKNLKDKGVIQGFTARIDSEKMGYNTNVLILIKADGRALTQLEDDLKRHMNNVSVYDLAGEYDIALISKFKDEDEFKKYFNSIQSKKVVDRAIAYRILKRLKECEALPL